jgi:RHS repeat-associated protein
MVLVTEQEYDSGAGGDGLLTRQVQHVDLDSRNSRATCFAYDCRDRLITTDGEIDYFSKNTYDNQDRVVTAERYDTTESGNLVARTETSYDDQGRVYQTVTYAVDVTTGTVTGHITANTWYDASGRVIKQRPGGSEQFTKTQYDGLGRPIKTFVGYDVADTWYDEAASVDDDSIFEQSETLYDDAGNLIETILRQRYHNATGTGELRDATTEPKARVTCTAAWHDGAGRQIASADYGTNGGEEFVRPDTVPDRSDLVLVTSTLYNDRGEGYATIDPMGREDRVVLDDAGRTMETIENYKSSPLPPGEGRVRADENKTTRTTYAPDGGIATLTAVNPTTGDQVTRYIYGTTLLDSQIARSDLLRAEIYPDSDDTSWLDDGDDEVYDRIEYSYSRQGEMLAKRGQNETVHWYEHDKLGRNTQDRVMKLGSGVDGQVRRIGRTYDVRGLVEKITSYSQPAVRTGAILNEVTFLYNDLGLAIADYQAHSGAVDMTTTPVVQYGYDDTTVLGEFIRGLRPTSVTYPNGRVVRYEYGDADSSSSSSGPGATDPDDCLNRIKFIADDNAGAVGTHLAEYHYLGLLGIVAEDYTEPHVKLDYTFDGYASFDRFGRIIDQRWQNYATSTDLDRYQYGYDRAGNRTYRQNLTTTERDEFYTYDGLNRLVRADRGNLDATKLRIAGLPEHQESWSLDPTGNWSGYEQRNAGHTVLDQHRTHNAVNELTGFNASVGAAWSNPSHDRAGNMTRIPKPSEPSETLTLRWDAWNRLVKVSDAVGVVAEYAYDGRNYRIVNRIYRDPSDPLSALSLPLSRHFYHNTRWQVLEERIGESSLSETQYVWSPRYIDAPILRDRSFSPTERLYYVADANFNITTLLTQNGPALERYAYAPYGEPTFWSADWFAGRASSACDNRILYTGREFDSASGAYYYRMRWYDRGLGAFISRDPMGHEDGIGSLYCYVSGYPIGRTDPSGRRAVGFSTQRVTNIEGEAGALRREHRQFLATSSEFFGGVGGGNDQDVLLIANLRELQQGLQSRTRRRANRHCVEEPCIEIMEIKGHGSPEIIHLKAGHSGPYVSGIETGESIGDANYIGQSFASGGGSTVVLDNTAAVTRELATLSWCRQPRMNHPTRRELSERLGNFDGAWGRILEMERAERYAWSPLRPGGADGTCLIVLNGCNTGNQKGTAWPQVIADGTRCVVKATAGFAQGTVYHQNMEITTYLDRPEDVGLESPTRYASRSGWWLFFPNQPSQRRFVGL